MKTTYTLIAFLLLFGGCGIIDFDRDGGPERAVEVVNQTDRDLFVSAMTKELLTRALIASELFIGDNDPEAAKVLAPSKSRLLPYDEVGGELTEQDTVVFLIYAETDETNEGKRVFRLAQQLPLDFEELAERSNRLEIHKGDLAFSHLFGDPYWVIRDEGDVSPEVHEPLIANDSLEAWVAFSGCAEGTFNLSQANEDGTGVLVLFHDYPDADFDCERLNVKEVKFELLPEILALNKIVLLNPNDGTDPYDHAFVLKP